MEVAKRDFGGLHVLVNNAVQFVFGHLMPPGTGSCLGTDRNATVAPFNPASRVLLHDGILSERRMAPSI